MCPVTVVGSSCLMLRIWRQPMSTQVTVTLCDEVYGRAERLAEVSQRDVADLLSEVIVVSLPELRLQGESSTPGASLTDAQVLALSDLQLTPSQDRRFSALLERQQAGTATETERSELASLMQLYQESLLRKALALQEAVRRGLREPLRA
jgi:hypothetical protein